MDTARAVQKALTAYQNKEKTAFLPKFFKTGPGEYSEGDRFCGVVVPDIRKVARAFRELPLSEVKRLLHSEWHEDRLCALVILVEQYKRSDDKGRDSIIDFYLKHLDRVNNWDLVDLSAPHLLGDWLLSKPKKARSVLYDLAKSGDLWRERVAMLATYAFIKNDEFKDALRLAKGYLGHEHDLMHKAVGWMLREIGKRDRAAEESFLALYYKKMPRTMLRYAIEKFPEKRRQEYLRGLA